MLCEAEIARIIGNTVSCGCCGGPELHGAWLAAEKIVAALKPIEREAGWVFVSCDDKGSLCNLPKHEQEVLFVYGQSVYAGCFLDDVRLSHYPDGEKYDGDFGFYTNDDDFYEAEHVRCWMPSPVLPSRNEFEDNTRRGTDE